MDENLTASHISLFSFLRVDSFYDTQGKSFSSQLLKNTQRCGWSFDGSLAFRAAPVGPDPPVVANGKVLPQAQWQWGSSSVYYCVEASLHDKYNKDSSIYKSNTVDLNWNKDKYITVGLIEDIF